MTTWKTLLAAFGVAGLLLALTVLITQTISGQSERTGTDTHVHIDPLDPHDAEPAQVTRNALTMIYSWNPAADASSWQALHRAKDLLTGPLADAAAAAPDPAPRPIAQWSGWALARETITGAVLSTSEPDITGDHAQLSAVVTQTVLRVDNTRTLYRTVRLTVSLTRVEGTWLVSNCQEKEEIR